MLPAMPLAPGLYEHALTTALAAQLGEATSEVHELRTEQLANAIAKHLGGELQRALASLPAVDRGAAGTALVDGVLTAIATVLEQAGIEADVGAQRLAPPPRQLYAVGAAPHPSRPMSTLSASTLFTRSHLEPGLSSELGREIACADRVDVLIAFITVGGVRVLYEALSQLAGRGGEGLRLRILTTTFTGTTEAAALRALARLPRTEVKVSFDTRRTRLHAKAWLFHRGNGLTTAYVGSANLTSTALGAGHEWVVKVSATDLPHVVDRFAGTFETLWQDPEFERYDPEDPSHHARVEAARAAQHHGEAPALTLFALRPYPFQEAILDRLRAERDELGHRRNLIVAATGTGKTVIAAFDYARQVRGVPPRLLFLAHRLELLTQARDTFRHVLLDGAFGDLVSGGHEATRGDHVFATIQSAAALVARYGAAHFSHVILDECHHLPATSYQAVLRALQPTLLVGLTATPERSDGQSLLPDFDGRIAAELRLWHALTQQLLVPFEYYGLSDNTDLRKVRWTRTGYEAAALAGVYTGNDARARLVLQQLGRRVADLRDVRGLGFCVSVEHAEYMAARATALGVPALAVHGGTPADVRADAPRRLREREVNLLFTCDLYNEGVDLPFVDVLLLLRPTCSPTLFLQQLGRGLRLHPHKQTCLVLDFIGQHREEYRFEATLAALTGLPRARLRASVEQGFPQLPSGCALSLDAVAREQILTSLRRTLGGGARRLGAELRELASAGPVDLPTFLAETGRELADVYTDDFGWREVQVQAGAIAADPDADDLSRRLGWLRHVDEPTRLRAYRALTTTAAPLAPLDARRLVMLDAQLNVRGILRAAEETATYFRTRPAAREELGQMTTLLEEHVGFAGDVYPEADWPLALHRRYQRREIVAAVGHRGPGDKISIPQGGILKLEPSRRELLFVTLDKSSGGFSPTTSYRDRAISRELFHWETQGVASVSSPTSRRYLDSPGNGWRFFLFVQAGKGDPYAFLGPATYRSHAGDRPIGITWSLDHPLPGALFEELAVLAQG
jgi:superfamily II DNA or RNA helicase/HKD family nuclease